MHAYVVSPGVTSSGLTLSATDTLTVLSRGATVAIADGGALYVSSGGDLPPCSRDGADGRWAPGRQKAEPPYKFSDCWRSKTGFPSSAQLSDC
jgi:hypothetical protein